MIVRFATAGSFIATLTFASLAPGQVGSQRVASGLTRPIFATYAPGNGNSLFILERGGDIEMLNTATRTVGATPFFSIPSSQVNSAGEGGVLGLAFDPDFAANNRFYVNMTTGNTTTDTSNPFRTEIRRYTYNAANPAASTFDTILSFNQPDTNHNGGWIGFNPTATGAARHDLYIASGDGGGSNDPGNNAQTISNNKLGKILRINVAGGSGYTSPGTNPFVGITGDDEILAHGLRNPFRASFDRQTGLLYIGDVGQDTREEIDRLDPATIDAGTGRAPVRNYGWRLREGTVATPTGGVGGSPPTSNVEPLYDYASSDNTTFPVEFRGDSVTGGVVYRGPVTALQGKYIFGDFATNRIWSFDPANPYGTVTNITSQLVPPAGQGTIGTISAFGEDAAGNVYIVDIFGGEVFTIVPEPTLLAWLAAPALLMRRRRS